MQIDLFKIPIFVTSIDSSKINLEYKKIERQWESQTLTSYSQLNYLNKESTDYLLETIVLAIEDFIKINFKVTLTAIWENIYDDKESFQENHIHTNSHFSFIIYKKIKESKTVFFAPYKYLLECFYSYSFIQNYFPHNFQPCLKENQMNIFPSFLEHMVKPISNSITISGNLNIEKN